MFTYDVNGNQSTSVTWRHASGYWVGATNLSIYDGQNRVVQTVDANGGTNTIIYDAAGRQQTTINALGYSTTFGYDYLGRLTVTTNPGQTTTTSAYDSNGNRISTTDQRGNTTLYFYDSLNRLTNTAFPDLTTNLTFYDDLSRVRFSVDARCVTNAFGYDAAGRRIAVTNALGVGGIQMTNGYSFDPNGNQIAFTDALGHTTTNTLDSLNRVVQVLYPDATTNLTGYDAAGRRVAETNQDGVVTRFGYDGAGRLGSVTNAFGTGQQIVTQYQYDEAGNETAHIDALGRTTAFAYDSLGHRISRTLPGLQTEGLGYDAGGNLIRNTNFNNVVITNQYDAVNRLTNRMSAGGYQVNFAYDAAGNRTNMTDHSGITGYTYDNRNRLLSKSQSWRGGPAILLDYAYDANGNLTNLWSSSSGGITNLYQYDAIGRLTNVLADGSQAASYGFDLNGNLQSVRYGNGITNLYQYDALNRLTNSVWKSNTFAFASFYYQLGATGNRTNLLETLFTSATNRNYSWAYDRLYRLTNETITSLGTLVYGLDPVGNRTNRSGSLGPLGSQTFTYTSNDWFTTDAYDRNGNTLWSTNGALRGPYYYDVENRLTNYNGSVYFDYNGDGIRVSKTVGSQTTFYLIDERNPTSCAQVLEEWVAIGTVTNLSKVYAFGLALIAQRQPTVSTNYLIPDGHGSTRLLTDKAGSVANAFVYDAYGSLIASNVVPQTLYLYCGEQFDPDIGFDYLRTRYYSLNTGRFWTIDGLEGSSEDPSSEHKYLYGYDDPINTIDPNGTSPEVEVMAASTISLALSAWVTATVVKEGAAIKEGIDVYRLARRLHVQVKYKEDPDPQYLYFLHGTSLRTWGESISIDPEMGSGNDFGRGFYTFAEGEGRYWAADRARQSAHGFLDVPIVIAVKIKRDEFAQLSKKDFRDPKLAPFWQSFVKMCRTGQRHYGYAGVIIGPVSNGNSLYPERHPQIKIPQYKFETGVTKLKFAYVYPAWGFSEAAP